METYVIKFKTTKHGSKRYEYREHTWYLSKQLKIQDLLPVFLNGNKKSRIS